MKRELFYWVVFALLSALIIGVITGFKFGELDIQMHDTYYVFSSFNGVKSLTLFLGTGRYFYLLLDIITEKYKIITLFLSIINAIVALFTLIVAYLSIETIPMYTGTYPDINFSGHLFVTIVLLGVLAAQIIVEIKMLRKLNGLLINM
jgi:hypothetical protein